MERCREAGWLEMVGVEMFVRWEKDGYVCLGIGLEDWFVVGM